MAASTARSAPGCAAAAGSEFLYITGSRGEAVLTANDGDACLYKPFTLADLVAAVKIIERIANAEAADLPIPPGFAMLSQRPDKGVPET